MLNLVNQPIFCSVNSDIKAYVITLKNNNLSESLSNRCVDSLKNVGMSYSIWPAFDGTNGNDIFVPDHLKEKDFLSWIKLSNDRMTKSEIGLFLSHFSLWAHCCTINEPIVILEHDAIMVKPYKLHKYPNSIYYLGNELQDPSNPTMQWFFIRDSYYFMAQSHAYAIDPAMARNLVSHTIKYGITSPIDNFIRMDVFTVVQDDFYAYELPGKSTIIKS